MDTGADLVLTGSAVWVGDGTVTDAIAVRDGLVVALGADAVTAQVRPRTRRIHAAGELVVPGFQDCHVHAAPAGRDRLTVDLHDLPGRHAYLDAVAAHVDANPGAGWIVGGGWALEHFPGGAPRREDLDAVTGGRPAFLFNRDVHGAWVNTTALALAGIDARTADPSDGRYERDADGAPSGMLHEGAAYTFRTRWVPEPSRQDWEAAILDAEQHLFTLGVTAFQDAWVTPETFEAYRSLAADGRLRAHVVGALWWDRHRGLEQIPAFLGRREQQVGTFHPTTVKIMVDGVIESRTAAMLEPYCSGCGGHDGPSADEVREGGRDRGLDYVDRDQLVAAVTALDAHGFQVHMHAIGDRAVRNALDAVEAAQRVNGVRDNRHHIAHLQVVQPEDIGRFAALGVVANCQTYWAQTEPQMEEFTIPFIGADRARLQYPFASLHRAGARLAMGSDWAVTTADPLQQMEVALRRVDPENRDVEPFLPEQALTLDTALTAFTAGSAFVNHDDSPGTLAVGARADLVVIDQDLRQLGGRLGDASAVCTVASGQVVHDRSS